jgi:hypothetical protein
MEGTPGPDLGSGYASVHDAIAECMSEPLLWSLFWRFMQPLRTISNLMDVVETPESQSPAWEDPIGALLGYQAGMEAHTC